MIPPALLEDVERAVRDALGPWPPAWQKFHWPGYTLEHTLRVRRLALRLAREEGADRDVVDLAALLHDLAKPEGDDHAHLGGERARSLLDGRLPDAVVGRIVQAVASHNQPAPEEPVECRVLSDADFIDANFGLVAVTRYLTIRGSRGLSLDEILADIASWETRHVPMLERLSTGAGRRCAGGRLLAMERFCREMRSDPVARAIACFLIGDSARPSLARQADEMERDGVPGAAPGETRPFVERLRGEMGGEL